MLKSDEPKHVAIVLDGNRRFAKKLMLEPWKGHEYGKKKVEKLLDYAKDLGIKEMTLYALSSDNIKNRPKNELKYLFKLFKETFRDLDYNKLREYDIRVNFIGNIDLLPRELADQIFELEEKTKKHKRFILNLAISYGGREELVNAVKRIIEEGIDYKEVDESVIKDNLYLQSEPDLVIRTGGEKRTSNFLPWQTAYSEWFFLDKMWPEFEKEDLIACINEFKNRKRNFGA